MVSNLMTYGSCHVSFFLDKFSRIMYDANKIKQIQQTLGRTLLMKKVHIGVSARHIHLSKAHIEILFGQGYTLNEFKTLSQPGQFAAEEVVSVQGPKGRMENIRILGPARGDTQLEISRTDGYALGVNPPLRQSGDIAGTPGIKVIGPAGELDILQGVIVAARHIHFHSKDALAWGITDKQMLKVKLDGERPLILENVLARVSDQFALDLHIDTDEANAAGVKTNEFAEILD
jgi:putative phosphotransacetylase